MTLAKFLQLNYFPYFTNVSLLVLSVTQQGVCVCGLGRKTLDYLWNIISHLQEIPGYCGLC